MLVAIALIENGLKYHDAVDTIRRYDKIGYTHVYYQELMSHPNS